MSVRGRTRVKFQASLNTCGSCPPQKSPLPSRTEVEQLGSSESLHIRLNICWTEAPEHQTVSRKATAHSFSNSARVEVRVRVTGKEEWSLLDAQF